MQAVRGKQYLDVEGLGQYSGKVWGHPMFLMAYEDVPAQADAIPLHLLV